MADSNRCQDERHVGENQEFAKLTNFLIKNTFMLWLFEERERDEFLLFLRIVLVFDNSYELIHTCWRSLIYLKYLLLSDDIWSAFCIGIGARSLHNT